ncbi:PcfJ domain-containing protein [Luteimonas mephitis]|uniref:PcfJ domain-containing protein n=1 Tax=Luteimonas mephitis TaxID=83615 RepID=UPI003A8E88F0
MMQLRAFGQWLRFLSAPTIDLARRRSHPAARKAWQVLVAFGKAHMLGEVELMAAKPVALTDDGVTRMVTCLRSVRYGYNRRDLTFIGAIREECGGWRFVPESDPFVVTFDTFLPLRAWRRRVRYALRADLRDTLMGLVNTADDRLTAEQHRALHELCEEIVEHAWCGLKLRKRLITRHPTKHMRRLIREALAVEPDLLALARASRFRSRYQAIDQKWLSFVWQHRGILERIRTQTPTLLKTVAQHMFRHGIVAGCDPTRECMKWLASNGIGKRSYRLLVRESDRPFREVLRRFTANQSLEALALALWLTESGHDATLPPPSFYRVTMDEFESAATASWIRKHLAVVPKRVFNEARMRMAHALADPALHGVALEYRSIVDWWVKYEPHEHAQASWERWLELAWDADTRQRVAMEPSTWPCALEELRTPDAEVLALGTPLAVFEEGRALRHCAYSYVRRCEESQVRLFAARMQYQGRTERATIGLQRNKGGGWRILDIRGTCNRRMPGYWIPLARQVAEIYTRNQATAQLPLPLDSSLDQDHPVSG